MAVPALKAQGSSSARGKKASSMREEEVHGENTFTSCEVINDWRRLHPAHACMFCECLAERTFAGRRIDRNTGLS